MNNYILYTPNGMLLVALLIVFILDFGLGITKATIKGTMRTSKGFRKTFTKFMQYGGSIIIAMVILNVIFYSKVKFGEQFSWLFGDTMLYIMIYIEIVSIFENMEEMGDNDFIRYFIRPVRRILTFQVKNLLKEDTETK
ncbi:MAG: phage holin family protein [Chryseobacterium sp.]